MLIDINNSNSNDRGYLCLDCQYKYIFTVKSKKNETFCKCLKWGTTVQNVGVCKFYKKEILQDVDIKKEI